MGNGLTFAHLSVIATGNFSGFRTITIPMEGIQGNQLNLHSLQQLGSREDLLHEATLLKSDFCTISSCNKRWLEYQNEISKRK